MEGRLRWIQKGYGGCTLSYQIRPGRRQMSSNHGAERNRGNRPFVLTSARLSTTARGAAHRRKWLISGPERALRCGAPPPPLPTAHLSRRWPEARWPSCESVDERMGVWSWPAPRVQPDVLLDVGVGPERAQGGRNPPQRTVSRAGGVEPARIRAGERAARGSIFAANSSSVSCSRTAFGGATSRRVPSPMTIRPTVHQPAPGCRPRVTGWSPRSRPALGWEMPSPASQSKTPFSKCRLVAMRKRRGRAGARGRRCARRRFRFAASARDSPGRQRRADFTASRARTNVVMVRSPCAASRRRAKPCVGAIWYLVGRSRGWTRWLGRRVHA